VSLLASKHAYVIGSAILMVGIIVQVIYYELDVWLPVTVAIIVLASEVMNRSVDLIDSQKIAL
jgi:hypothetical protein